MADSHILSQKNNSLMKPASLLVVFYLLVAACGSNPSDDKEYSRAGAEGDARYLIDSVSDNHDCAISLGSVGNSLGLELGLDTVRHSASVFLSGEQCAGAIQELQDRGRAFSLEFAEIRTVEIPVEDDPNQILDLIHEIDPEIEN
ncbi:MAG: hypothetical protein AAGA44_15205 [Pseudomonadota bacterium]